MGGGGPNRPGGGAGRRAGGKQVLRVLQVLMVQHPPPGVGGGGPNRPGGGVGIGIVAKRY